MIAMGKSKKSNLRQVSFHEYWSFFWFSDEEESRCFPEDEADIRQLLHIIVYETAVVNLEQFLLSLGSKVSAVIDRVLYSPSYPRFIAALYAAIEAGKPDFVEVLLRYGANPVLALSDDPAVEGDLHNPVVSALAALGHSNPIACINIINVLLKKYPQLLELDFKYSPLEFALLKKLPAIVIKFLIVECHVVIDSESFGFNVFHSALWPYTPRWGGFGLKPDELNTQTEQQNCVENLQLLLQYHPVAKQAVNAVGCGLSPLHIAVLRGYTSAARLLLEHGAEVNLPSIDYNETPLHLLSYISREEIDIAGNRGFVSMDEELVKLLVGRGARFDAQDDAGNIPLTRACLSLLQGKRFFESHPDYGQYSQTKFSELSKRVGWLIKYMPDSTDKASDALVNVEIPNQQGDTSALLLAACGEWTLLKSYVEHRVCPVINLAAQCSLKQVTLVELLIQNEKLEILTHL
jgi:hypothetical protein